MGNPQVGCVAEHMLDARTQTEAAPDEQTELRCRPANQSLITDVTRLRPLLCTIHRDQPRPPTAARQRQAARSVLDWGHQNLHELRSPCRCHAGAEDGRSLEGRAAGMVLDASFGRNAHRRDSAQHPGRASALPRSERQQSPADEEGVSGIRCLTLRVRHLKRKSCDGVGRRASDTVPTNP